MRQLMKIFMCKSIVGEVLDSMNKRLIDKLSWKSEGNGISAGFFTEN